MHNNALSHISKLTCDVFEHKRFTGEKIMEWPLSSSDPNPMENCEDKMIWR